MEAIPTDIVLLIVECITLKSDLKALCQTSRTWRKLVLPRLYHRVHLISWDENQYRLRQFARCIAAGAGAHLRYTRCLIIEDTKPPAEPQIQSAGRSMDFREDIKLSGDPEEYEEMIDAFILLLLEMFPRNGLHMFGFISDRSISIRVLSFLCENQKDLKQMKISWGLTWHPDFTTRPIFTGLSALDICIAESRGMQPLVETFLKSSPNLKRLSIGVAYQIPHRMTEASLSLAIKEAAVTLPELQELTLFNFWLQEEQLQTWQQLTPLSNLRRLTVFCGLDSFNIVGHIDEDNSHDGLNIHHLAIDTCGLREEAFLSMLRSCKLLTSLHVRLDITLNSHDFLQGLRHHGPSLRTLAICFYTNYEHDTDPFHQPDFDELCKLCSNVCFLGLQASAIDLDPVEWASPTVRFLSRLSSLTRMSGLRLIHIRWSSYPDLESARSRVHTMAALQKFCNAVFHYMFVQKACSSLKAIVVGHNIYDDFEPSEIYCTQHCFIRDYETEASETRAVAIPVHAYRIRELLPDCDLLDYDPLCESLAHLPGRLQF